MLSNPIKIISKVKDYADEIWVENMVGSVESNSFRRLLSRIHYKYPETGNVYRNIYYERDDTYWEEMWKSVCKYCDKHGIKNKVRNRIQLRYPEYFR